MVTKYFDHVVLTYSNVSESIDCGSLKTHNIMNALTSLKHNSKIYLNFNKLLLIYIINKEYKCFYNWTYIIHNCITIMLISWFSDVSSKKSDMWKYNGTSLCLPKALATHGTSTTVVSKVVARSTNAARESSMENGFFFFTKICLRFLLLIKKKLN